ncbi:HalOD1 output domain-containing protein [Halorientalis pallida]|uniref:Halobacterial output domain-containing protein n=1 Tax=Halorientalis pallida TaxID=2479928 RepID=A0A498KZZ2_9EURY|nr:HalOD1 output domain-containing protein [Halorientalis pallida]RXK50153.1 hypothetical protein EAF64_06210 [Halorientalis pallida]
MTDESTIRLEFDPEAEDMPAVAVVSAVATATETAVDDFDHVLDDELDAKALNSLFDPGFDRTHRDLSALSTRFTFCDCRITVSGEGWVRVESG